MSLDIIGTFAPKFNMNSLFLLRNINFKRFDKFTVVKKMNVIFLASCDLVVGCKRFKGT